MLAVFCSAEYLSSFSMREKNIIVFYGIRTENMRIAILGYAWGLPSLGNLCTKTLVVKIYFREVFSEGGSNPFLNHPVTS
jgi:hypothetical protein